MTRLALACVPYAIVSVLFLSACRGEIPVQNARAGYDLCNRGVTRTSDGTLRVCEAMTEDTVERVKRIITDDDTRIILTSGGGTAPPAMALGRIIRERDLSLQIRQFCLSACSTYVLPASRRITVEPYAIVAFHHTSAFVIDVMASLSDLPTTSAFRAPAEDERAYFREMDVDPKYLLSLGVAVEPLCTGIRTAGQRRERYVNYRWSWFVPTSDEMRAMLGNRLAGYWPTSAMGVEQILRPTTGNPNLNVRFGGLDENPPTAENLAATLKSCS